MFPVALWVCNFLVSFFTPPPSDLLDALVLDPMFSPEKAGYNSTRHKGKNSILHLLNCRTLSRLISQGTAIVGNGSNAHPDKRQGA